MKQIIITVCMMLLTMSISAKTLVVADKKIVVLSDPHVMAPELLVSEGEAWTNYLSGQRKMVDYSQALFDEMVAKIKDEIKPNLVLITGDLTKDGEQLSHTYVISKLDELRGVGIQTLVIPGNHDRGANADAVVYDGATTSPVDVATNGWFAIGLPHNTPIMVMARALSGSPRH